jgi:hypothetical protein
MVVILEEENGDWISTVFEKHKEPVNFYNSDKYKFLEF